MRKRKTNININYNHNHIVGKYSIDYENQTVKYRSAKSSNIDVELIWSTEHSKDRLTLTYMRAHSNFYTPEMMNSVIDTLTKQVNKFYLPEFIKNR